MSKLIIDQKLRLKYNKGMLSELARLNRIANTITDKYHTELGQKLTKSLNRLRKFYDELDEGFTCPDEHLG